MMVNIFGEFVEVIGVDFVKLSEMIVVFVVVVIIGCDLEFYWFVNWMVLFEGLFYVFEVVFGFVIVLGGL